MKIFKIVFLLIAMFLLNIVINAQDKMSIKFGKVTPQDFDVKAPATDSAANAIVVADYGNSEFVANTSDLTVSLEFTKKTRIKIVDKNGFDAGTVHIYLYSSGASTEKLESLKAYTYNLENNKVVETKIDNSSIFTENKSKNWIVKKFTFPALKEGSIVEYSYTIKSDFFFNLQAWAFQGKYPCLWSEYNASIPEFYKYVTLSQGYQPFFINKVDQSQVQFTFRERVVDETSARVATTNSESFNITGMKDNHRWVMKNVPGLKEEAFTTTLNNHIAKLEFQLSQIKYPNAFPHFYMNDWKKVAEEFRDSEKFGSLINRANGWLDDDLKGIVGNAATANEKAKKIFSYLRDNISIKSGPSIFASTNLKDVIKNKSGTVADINLLLIAMLRHEKITANPIILGTRSRGVTNEFYPLIDRYNYVIVKADIDGVTTFLDASHPRIGFGKLPLECYNGHAREVQNEMLYPIYFSSDSLKEFTRTNCIIINDEKDGKVVGSVTKDLGYYSSLKVRNEIAGSSLASYEKKIKSGLPEDVEITNLNIDSLKILDEPIVMKFDTKFSAFGENDIVYFSPLIESIIKKNPFTAAQRFYPVEMPYTINETYTFNMEIPKGYIVDEIPKSTRVKLNDSEGMFEYIIRKDASYVQLQLRLLINKANFNNDDYDILRDFYSFVVKKESEQIVFKKVKK